METAPQQQNWWQKNWKWALPGGCIGCFGLILVFVLGISALVFSVLKSTDVYEESLQRAQTSPQVIEALGEPVEAGWLVSGAVNVTGPSGDANLSIPLSGPKGTGTLFLIAEKRAGAWEFDLMNVEIEGSGERIDLLDGIE